MTRHRTTTTASTAPRTTWSPTPRRPRRATSSPSGSSPPSRTTTSRPRAGAAGALQVLRRGLATSPELRVGLKATIVFAIVAALGKLAIPILIQVILDRGVLGSGGFRAEFVLLACLGAVVITIGVLFVSRIAYYRLVRAAEQALCSLRVRVFDHIHRLSMAEHTTTRRGVFVSRVTSDIETLARFVQWGMISWLVNGTLIVGTLVVMFVYSWQLTLAHAGRVPARSRRCSAPSSAANSRPTTRNARASAT